MTEPTAVLSVRGHARRLVAADRGEVDVRLWSVGADEASARAGLAEALAGVTEHLIALGGSPRAAETERAALTWAWRPVETYAQRRRRDPNRGARTGRIVAHMFAALGVRDFALLADIESMVVAHPTMRRRQVRWSADEDNPAWGEVRAEALQDAFRVARDYAAGLGGRLLRVEHVADDGLLHHDHGFATQSARQSGSFRMNRLGGGETALAIQPQPVRLTAAVEARFVAGVAALNQPM